MAAAFTAMLSPMIRRFPRALAAAAGGSAWLAPLFALPMAALYLFLLRRLYRNQPPGTGLAELFSSALGPVPGRALTGLYGLWFTAYAGFLLRSGAERFISTVYPDASPAVFILPMALLCLCAALGRVCAIARAAMLFRPLLLGLFGLVSLLTLRDFDPALLRPVREELAGAVFAGAQTLNLLASVGFLAFFSDQLTRPPGRADRPLLRLGEGLLVILLMSASCLGVFGAGLTAKLSYPFFMLARDVSVLGSLERAEPVVVALWVLSDFIMLSLLLTAAGKCLRFCFGCGGGIPDRPRDLRRGRWLIPVCASAAVGCALALPAEAEVFRLLSERSVPLLSAAAMLVLPLLVLLVGLLRRRL